MIFRQSLFLLGITVFSTPIPAQTQTEAPAFEVASVKANTANFSVQRPGIRTDPGRLVATNVSLKALVVLAYGIKREPIFGGPSWIDSLRFNIEAKADREKKELPVFVLVVGKYGSKLRQVEAKANPQIRFQPTGGNFRLIGEHAPMERLVDWMGSDPAARLILVSHLTLRELRSSRRFKNNLG